MGMQNRQQRDGILFAKNNKPDTMVGENGEQAFPSPLLRKV